mgnify:CR=1 FL=1
MNATTAGVLAGLTGAALATLLFSESTEIQVGAAEAVRFGAGVSQGGATPRYSPLAWRYAAAGKLYQGWSDREVRDFLMTAQNAEAAVVNQMQIDLGETLSSYKGKARADALQRVSAEATALRARYS